MARSAPNLERTATELVTEYGIKLAPVPLESILQHPLPNMWQTVNLNTSRPVLQAVQVPFGTRMTLAQLLARLLIESPWGEQRGLATLRGQSAAVHTFGRAILIPRILMMALPAEVMHAQMISRLYEAPVSEAATRLSELGVTELSQSA